MTIDIFPTSFSPLTPSSGITLLADNGTNNGFLTVANVLGQLSSLAIPIGSTTPAAGSFTSLAATSVNLTGGTINGAVIGGVTPAAGSFTTLSASGQSVINQGSDDPTNASGLGAPAIIRGTVYAHLAAGVTVGAGQTTTVRQATAVGLQNAITYAATNGKIFEIIPNIYEINNTTGLIIPAQQNGFTWRGERGGVGGSGYGGSQIVQYNVTAPGTPALTIGDSTGGSVMARMDFNGVHVRYGAAQPITNTGACTLVIGPCTVSNIDNIGIQQGGSYSGGSPQGFNGYVGVYFVGGQFFSNVCSNWEIFGCQQTYFLANNFSTGNIFNNIYLNGGGGTAAVPLAGNFVSINTNNGASFEVKFNQLNCEWASCNRVLNFTQGMVLIDMLHVEGINFTGVSPGVLITYGSALDIRNLNLVDPKVLLANIAGSGGAVLFQDWPGEPSNFIFNNVSINSETSGNINAQVQIAAMRGGYPGGTYGKSHGSCSIDKAVFSDSTGTNQISGIFFDEGMQPTSSTFLVPASVSKYEFGSAGSDVLGAVIPVKATYTHYGQYTNATLIVPTSVTGFTITLAATMAASPSNQPVNLGNKVHFTRTAGTSSGIVLVKDDAGTTLSTFASGVTTPTDADYIFNGTHYVTFTPVGTSPYNP